MPNSHPWGARILLAEDDLLIGELVMLHLSAAGHQPSWVRSGKDVLPRISDFNPQLLVLDLGLPVVSGFEILAAIRKTPGLSALKILVLTARHAPEDVKMALALGADDYIAKPFEVSKLLTRIGRLLTATRAVARPLKERARAVMI